MGELRCNEQLRFTTWGTYPIMNAIYVTDGYCLYLVVFIFIILALISVMVNYSRV